MQPTGHTSECIQCIRRVLSYEEFAADCSSDHQLCELFSDGEILCSILTELSNGRVSYDGTTSYYSKNSHLLARKNLQFFLTECRQAFDLEDHELFEPDDLLTFANPERVVKTVLRLVSGIRDRKEAEAAPPSNGSSGFMKNVVKEICDHELALTDKLAKLMAYRSELQGLLSEWSDEFVHVVFKHVDELYDVHKEFHTRLTDLSDQGCQQFCQQLSTLFNEMRPKLEIYFQYYAHIPAANVRMETEFQRAPELKNQLKALERHFRGLSFRGLFDAPIRQTTNYLTLFKRLHDSVVKEMDIPEASESVEKAMQDIEVLLDRANEFKRQAEQLTATREVLAQVSDLPAELTDPAEIGLHQADACFKVRVVRDDGEIDTAICYCVLTTKQLILGKMASKLKQQATYWFSIPISSSLQLRKKGDKVGWLELVADNEVKASLKASKSGGHSSVNWPSLLEKTRALNCPRGWNTSGHRFELRTFPAGSRCTKCSKELSGAAMQGFSCSHCDRRLHLECLRQNDRRGSAPALPIRRSASDCYHRELSREKANKLLKKCEVGTFLLRDSSAGGKVLVIRSRTGVEHVLLSESNARCCLDNTGLWFSDLDSLVEFYRSTKLSESSFRCMDFTLGEGLADKHVIKSVRRQGTLDEEGNDS